MELNSPSSIEGLNLVEAERPNPKDDELLVQMLASSLNFHDYLVATGVLPAARGRVPLSDGVGKVIAVGNDVTAFKPGDRVLGTFFPDWIDGSSNAAKISRMRGDQVDGFACEYVALSSQAFTKAPASLTDVEAATLPCAGLTAWRALMVEGGVKPGETVLIEGTGGVSIFALQFARMAGAIVIGLSSSEEKLARLKQLGAQHVLNYRDEPKWGARVREMTGGAGADHVVEVVGGDLAQALQACRVGGRLYIIGALSRKPIEFPARLVINGNVRVIGLTVGSRTHQLEMVQAIEANGLKPVVDRIFPLSELKAALRHQEAGAHFGKICITC
jgi:NADPH:quinone reductase-like Zn-dependent oxidoreductase